MWPNPAVNTDARQRGFAGAAVAGYLDSLGHMQRADVRDIILTVLVGAASPWIWASLIGVLGALTYMPPLISLAREFGPSIRPWLSTYEFIWEIIGGAVCALLVALPTGYLLRRNVLPLWVLFAALFLAGLTLSALGTEDPVIFFLVLSLPGPWIFLFWSAVFFFVGQLLRRRHNVA